MQTDIEIWQAKESQMRAERDDLRKIIADLRGALAQYRRLAVEHGCPENASPFGWLQDNLPLMSKAACAAMRKELVNVVMACPSPETTDPGFWPLVLQIKKLLEATDAGQPILDALKVARRMSKACGSLDSAMFAQLKHEFDAADAKLWESGRLS